MKRPLKGTCALALTLSVTISFLSATLVMCDGGPIWSGDIDFSFFTTARWGDQYYKAAYMTTGHLGYDTERDDYISATSIKVTVSFSGTNTIVFSSLDALAIGVAAQGPDHLDRFPAAVDWGYLLLLVLDGRHNYPYIQGMVWMVWEWGRNGLFPIESADADDVSHWKWEYPGVLNVDSNVTLKMTWTPETLEYDATIDGNEYHLYSYTPQETVSHYFKLALHDRHVRLDPFATGTVKWLQFPGAWSSADSQFPESGWITHVAFPSLIMNGESTWTNINFSYSVDGDQAWLDNTVSWGGEQFPNVDAHFYNEPWSLPTSEPPNQVFFYPNTSHSIPSDTLLWSIDPVDLTIDNVVPIPPHYDTVQVYQNGMRLNGEWISMNYSVTVNRSDTNADVPLLPVTVGIKRTNAQNANDYRVVDTAEALMCPGLQLTFNLTWRETDTLQPGTWNICGFAATLNQVIYYDTNVSDNQVTNDTVQAKELICDIQGDGMVDVLDAITLASAWNSQPGDLRWRSYADFNKDNIVDIFDALILASHFGERIGSGAGSGMSGESGLNGEMQADSGGTTSILLDTSQLTVFKNEVFTASLRIANVVDLSGWEFKLYWDNSMLNCTNAAIQTPTEWQGSAQNYKQALEPGYNATHGRFWAAQAANYPASSFNGSMTIATLTFQALQPGTTSLAIADTKLGNSTAQPIDHTDSGGSVTVYYGRYMRSDTKTVNGLNAYLLNATETTSYHDAGNVNSGRNAYWGIRVWIRHANGVEQEITLDGQTGTPKAVVARGSGAGMLSATTSVSQSTLQTTDSLVVRAYFRTSGSSWVEVASFTTEQLGATALTSTSWTVYYYTWAQYYKEGGYTAGHLYWGSPARNSRIQNLQYT